MNNLVLWIAFAVIFVLSVAVGNAITGPVGAVLAAGILVISAATWLLIAYSLKETEKVR